MQLQFYALFDTLSFKLIQIYFIHTWIYALHLGNRQLTTAWFLFNLNFLAWLRSKPKLVMILKCALAQSLMIAKQYMFDRHLFSPHIINEQKSLIRYKNIISITKKSWRTTKVTETYRLEIRLAIKAWGSGKLISKRQQIKAPP